MGGEGEDKDEEEKVGGRWGEGDGEYERTRLEH